MKGEKIKNCFVFIEGFFKVQGLCARALVCLSFFVFHFSLISCDIIYPLVEKEGAQEKEIIGEIVPFQHNATVEEVQRLLKLYGYNVGKVDGKFGNVTRDAIERFQTDQGLPVTRFVDDATWAKLRELEQSAFFAEGKVNIQTIQSALKNAGHDPGPIDGKFGKKTLEAVKLFQKSHDLKVDGVIGYQTIRALEQYLQQ